MRSGIVDKTIMNERNLQFADIAGPVADVQQTSDDAERIWTRIAGEHLRRRRRRRLRLAGSAVALVTCLTSAGFLVSWHASKGQVDWQARAQALELQLDAMGSDTHGLLPRSSEADLRFSLARVDRALQSAYDRRAPKSELSALWKRRSELLNTLLVARRGHLTRI